MSRQKQIKAELSQASYLRELYGECGWFWQTGTGKNWIASAGTQSRQRPLLPSLPIEPVQQDSVVIIPKPSMTPDPLWENYVQKLEGCKKCPRELLTSDCRVVHEWKKDIKTPLNLLFVTDLPQRLDDGKYALMGEEQSLLLKKMVHAMGQKEGEWAQTLIFKCPVADKNRELDPLLLKKCQQHLFYEIIQLRPSVIVTLGAMATASILGRKERLSIIHGQFFEQTFKYEKSTFRTKLVPLFHLDYLLINPEMKRAVWADLQKIMQHLGGEYSSFGKKGDL